MTPKEFDEFLDYVIKRAKESLASKSAEYSTESDKLYNFKEAGKIDDETPEQALWGMFKKHFVSLKDIKDNIIKGNLPTLELLDEKFKDTINYLILLEALIRERKKFQVLDDPTGFVNAMREASEIVNSQGRGI